MVSQLGKATQSVECTVSDRIREMDDGGQRAHMNVCGCVKKSEESGGGTERANLSVHSDFEKNERRNSITLPSHSRLCGVRERCYKCE